MVRSFTDGLIGGFEVVETVRDRRAARANEARRISLMEASEGRAQQAFEEQQITVQRGREREDLNARAMSALSRIQGDPDNPSPDDIRILEQAGFSQELGALTARREVGEAIDTLFPNQRGPALSDLAATPQATRGAVTQSPGEAAFLDASTPENLPPDQFPEAGGVERNLFSDQIGGSPRRVRVEDVREWLSEEDLGQIANEQPGAALRGPRLGNARIEIPAGVLTKSEIAGLPPGEQQAAIEQNAEILGQRRNELESVQAAARGRQGVLDQYKAVLDPGQDSSFRALAGRAPSFAVDRYAKDRATLVKADPNTAALMDTWMRDISYRSIANVQEFARNNIPLGEHGHYDFESPEAKDVKRILDTNIAFLRAVEDDFDVGREAQIRGGAMPVGNDELTGRVMAAMQNGPEMAARPITPHEERLANTRIRRAVEQSADRPARRVTTGELDAMKTLYLHGRLTLQQMENRLRTGQFDPATVSLVQVPPENDLYDSAGNLIRAARDPDELVRQTRGQAPEDVRETISDLFGNMYDESPRAAAENESRFWTYVRSQAPTLLEQRGIDVTNMGTADANALFFTFINEQKAVNKKDDSWFSFFNGSFREGRAPFSEEAMIGVRELGIEGTDLGGFQFGETEAVSLRDQMAQSEYAELRSAASASPQEISKAVRDAGGVRQFLTQIIGAQQ